MLTKSEIALLTFAVLGTLAAWLAVPRPSPASPIDGPPGMACSAPAIAVVGVRPSFGEERALLVASRMPRTIQ
jgi:hypothetical protein